MNRGRHTAFDLTRTGVGLRESHAGTAASFVLPWPHGQRCGVARAGTPGGVIRGPLGTNRMALRYSVWHLVGGR